MTPHYLKRKLLAAVLSLFFLPATMYTAAAQAPNAVPYQGVARNASGVILVSQPISLRFSIHDATAAGTVVYKETHSVTTSSLGLFNVNIGSGTPVSGTMAGVKWGLASKFLQVELDPAGGSTYTDMGTTQLNSVPYALYASNSGDWLYDSASTRLYLKRGLDIKDTTYFDTLHHEFLFADNPTYINSLGSSIPAVNFASKYTFKATASKNADSVTANSNTLGVFYEVDNASNQYAGGYTGVYAVTTINPTATQKDIAFGIQNTAIHAGQDTCYQLTGLYNQTYNNGVGETDGIYGVLNQTRLGTASNGNVGEMYSIYNSATRSAASTSRIKGNLYGYFGTLGSTNPASGIAGKVDGAAYGIFMTGVAGATGGNWALFTSQGRNRFGDSSVFSTSSAVPRAFFDINNSTSMIVPAGTTAQRPANQVAGMLRYNIDNGGQVEYNTGTGWYGTLRKVQSISFASPILPGAGVTQSFTVTGASTGSAVSISPDSGLSPGLIISWARVSAANTVEVRFDLVYGTAITPATQNYNVTVTRVQ
jgi:hypothetical protein